MAMGLSDNRIAPEPPTGHPQLHLICTNPNVDLKVNMGDGPATPTAGFAGHETVSRIRKTGMTAYVGTAPFAQDVPVLLDGYRENRSVERTLETLESLGGAAQFKAFGPIHHAGDLFIFGDEPEFGEAIRAEDGTLLRQALTLKLEEFVSADQAGKRRTAKLGVAPAIALSYTTVQGDTLLIVSNKVYRTWTRWAEIGRKNHISDPHKKLKAGVTLTL
jgi:hypothetical protein